MRVRFIGGPLDGKPCDIKAPAAAFIELPFVRGGEFVRTFRYMQMPETALDGARLYVYLGPEAERALELAQAAIARAQAA